MTQPPNQNSNLSHILELNLTQMLNSKPRGTIWQLRYLLTEHLPNLFWSDNCYCEALGWPNRLVFNLLNFCPKVVRISYQYTISLCPNFKCPTHFFLFRLSKTWKPGTSSVWLSVGRFYCCSRSVSRKAKVKAELRCHLVKWQVPLFRHDPTVLAMLPTPNQHQESKKEQKKERGALTNSNVRKQKAGDRTSFYSTLSEWETYAQPKSCSGPVLRAGATIWYPKLRATNLLLRPGTIFFQQVPFSMFASTLRSWDLRFLLESCEPAECQTQPPVASSKLWEVLFSLGLGSENTSPQKQKVNQKWKGQVLHFFLFRLLVDGSPEIVVEKVGIGIVAAGKVGNPLGTAPNLGTGVRMSAPKGSETMAQTVENITALLLSCSSDALQEVRKRDPFGLLRETRKAAKELVGMSLPINLPTLGLLFQLFCSDCTLPSHSSTVTALLLSETVSPIPPTEMASAPTKRAQVPVLLTLEEVAARLRANNRLDCSGCGKKLLVLSTRISRIPHTSCQVRKETDREPTSHFRREECGLYESIRNVGYQVLSLVQHHEWSSIPTIGSYLSFLSDSLLDDFRLVRPNITNLQSNSKLALLRGVRWLSELTQLNL